MVATATDGNEDDLQVDPDLEVDRPFVSKLTWEEEMSLY